MLANVFAPAQRSDYYETSLFLTTSSVATDVYLADINYDDLDVENPISPALRVDFAVHAPGQGQPVVLQYIFELTLLPSLTMLRSLPAASANADHGTPVQVDVYVWLEGCDEDCANNLANTNLESLALHFAGKQG